VPGTPFADFQYNGIVTERGIRMTIFEKAIRTSFAALLMAGGLSSSVYALGGIGPFGGELRQLTQVKAKVVCINCSIDEVRKTEPNSDAKLYQLSHNDGQVVIEVTGLNEEHRWRSIVGQANLLVRSSPAVFEKLMADENRFQEIQLTGLLKSTRTFHLYHIEEVQDGSQETILHETQS